MFKKMTLENKVHEFVPEDKNCWENGPVTARKEYVGDGEYAWTTDLFDFIKFRSEESIIKAIKANGYKILY